MKAFTVSSKDLFDKKKNPNLSLSVSDIAANNKIPKKSLGNCEWGDCSKQATITTSTETTDDGIIHLCRKHFNKLPI